MKSFAALVIAGSGVAFAIAPTPLLLVFAETVFRISIAICFGVIALDLAKGKKTRK